jgi:3-hydroxyisobutyrate dehydrogenase-like beta-hydroxyacid dehydrogenase
MTPPQFRLGLVGYGEVGHALGAGMRSAGNTHVVAYDIAWLDSPYSGQIRAHADADGVRLVESPEMLARESDFIIAVTPGSKSVAAASAIAGFLTSEHTYVDIASSTPRVKVEVARVLANSGAAVADGGIVGTPLRDGHRLPIVASGPAAERFRDIMNPWGLRIEVVGTEIGAGSAFKIVRSVVMKGLEALLVECGLASARYGIQDEVFASISAWMDTGPFMDTVTFLLRTNVIHAQRRSEEMEMSASALEEIGIEPIMTRATVRRLTDIAAMGLKEHFDGKVPDDHRVALAAVEARLGSSRP